MHQMTAADKDTQHSCIFIKLCRPSSKPSLLLLSLYNRDLLLFTTPMLMAMLLASSLHWQSRVHGIFANILTIAFCKLA